MWGNVLFFRTCLPQCSNWMSRLDKTLAITVSINYQLQLLMPALRSFSFNVILQIIIERSVIIWNWNRRRQTFRNSQNHLLLQTHRSSPVTSIAEKQCSSIIDSVTYKYIYNEDILLNGRVNFELIIKYAI